MKKLTQTDGALFHLDLAMQEVFTSWFSSGLDDQVPDEVRQMMYLHFRAAFIAGRLMGQRDVFPVVQQHAKDIRELLARLADAA